MECYAGKDKILRVSLSSLNYSRVKLAVDARRRGWSCGISPQIRCNEADAV